MLPCEMVTVEYGTTQDKTVVVWLWWQIEPSQRNADNYTRRAVASTAQHRPARMLARSWCWRALVRALGRTWQIAKRTSAVVLLRLLLLFSFTRDHYPPPQWVITRTPPRCSILYLKTESGQVMNIMFFCTPSSLLNHSIISGLKGPVTVSRDIFILG
jgi:hypothetical protein